MAAENAHERRVADSESAGALAADGAPVALSYLDASHRYLFVNRRYEECFGVAREAAAGRHARDVLGEQTYEIARPCLESALAGREASHELELTASPHGARRLTVVFTPDLDADGVARGCVAVAIESRGRTTVDRLEALTRDLESSRRRSAKLLERQTRDLGRQDELLDREARLRAILQSAVDGIIAIDESGRIQSFNPAAERLFGYSEAEVLGRNVKLLMPAPYRDEHDSYVQSYRRTGQARVIGTGREVQAQRKSGEVFPIHLSVGEARLGERRIFTGIIRDLTSRRRLEEQLAQSQKMEAIGRLAGGVAHDFNNVLQTIVGRCEALNRKLRAKDPRRRHTTEIRKASRRAAALTRQLLAVSRTQLLNPRVVDLNDVLRDTTGMLRQVIGEDVRFRLEAAPGLAAVKVDPSQMVQVVLNLVVNARDAMPRGGELVIETRNVAAGAPGLPSEWSGPAVLLAVRDSGQGMDEETLAQIFEPYFTTKGQKGTGLGLSTVYGIVQQSGGLVHVESRIGSGSTFKVLLPRAAGRPVTAEAPPQNARASGRRAARLLLVEDDVSARRALEQLLREEGHTVRSASNAEEAERLYQGRDPFDVVITDTVLPHVSGPELVARLRASQPGVKVIFMSGYAPETVLKGGSLDAGTAFLQKPIEVDDLLAKIEELVLS